MGLRTEYLVTELDRLCRLGDTQDPKCPECHGAVEITPSHAIVCQMYGSTHYRWEMPILIAHEADL